MIIEEFKDAPKDGEILIIFDSHQYQGSQIPAAEIIQRKDSIWINVTTGDPYREILTSSTRFLRTGAYFIDSFINFFRKSDDSWEHQRLNKIFTPFEQAPKDTRTILVCGFFNEDANIYPFKWDLQEKDWVDFYGDYLGDDAEEEFPRYFIDLSTVEYIDFSQSNRETSQKILKLNEVIL